MGRTPRCRRVDSIPETTYFKPAGVPVRVLEQVRLRDLEDLEQEECAEKMSISFPTFPRLLAGFFITLLEQRMAVAPRPTAHDLDTRTVEKQKGHGISFARKATTMVTGIDRLVMGHNLTTPATRVPREHATVDLVDRRYWYC